MLVSAIRQGVPASADSPGVGLAGPTRAARFRPTRKADPAPPRPAASEPAKPPAHGAATRPYRDAVPAARPGDNAISSTCYGRAEPVIVRWARRKRGKRRKGVRTHLCEAPSGPSRQMSPDPFFLVPCACFVPEFSNRIRAVVLLLLLALDGRRTVRGRTAPGPLGCAARPESPTSHHTMLGKRRTWRCETRAELVRPVPGRDNQRRWRPVRRGRSQMRAYWQVARWRVKSRSVPPFVAGGQ